MCQQCFKKPYYETLSFLTFEKGKIPKCPAMKALEELTPGGSEFYEDPERCAATIRATRDSQHRVILSMGMRLKAENK